MKKLLVVASLIALWSACGAAHAQAYPSKPIRWIVPFPPGGGTDLVARALAPRLTENMGVQVLVDNRPGGGTVIGAELAARSPPDGYTIFLGTNTSHAINPNLYAKLPYDALKDFAPVTQIASIAFILVVHPSLPVRTVKELVALAKTRPGQLNFASSGTGTPGQLAGVMLNSAAAIDIVHVPYKGGGPAVMATVSGETQLIFASLTATLPLVKGGRLRALAMSSAARSSFMPNLVTIAESGYPGFDASTWYSVFAPGATPAAIVSRLNAEFVKVIRSAEFRAWLADQGAEPVGSTPEAFAAFVKSEIALYGPLIRKAGMRPD